jgi:hypothetical protein
MVERASLSNRNSGRGSRRVMSAKKKGGFWREIAEHVRVRDRGGE